jgi:hypothetical protein
MAFMKLLDDLDRRAERTVHVFGDGYSSHIISVRLGKRSKHEPQSLKNSEKCRRSDLNRYLDTVVSSCGRFMLDRSQIDER